MHDLINSKDNIDELFKITEFKDKKICVYIFYDLIRYNLIENGSYHNIEFINEENQDCGRTSFKTIIKDSRI